MLAIPTITVVTAAGLDAHHERLWVTVPLRRLAALGLLRWRSSSYESCNEELVATSDLLILVRPRFPEVPALLDGAAAHAVAVAVLIDDNWIAAGREYPRFDALFTPRRPALETFLDAVRRADATLVFNPVIAEDLRGHARRVVELPLAIDLDVFAPPATPRPPGLLVGHAGSPRWEESAFVALAAFSDRNPDVRLFVMGHELPAALRDVDPARVSLVPWTRDYDEYARTLAAAAPDVLLAPLDGSRFSASKLPLKWLDAAAVGAA